MDAYNLKLNLELSKEQKEALSGLVSNLVELARKIGEIIRKIGEIIRETLNKFKEVYKIYILNLEPRKRYRFLKAVRIKNYVPFFKRDIFRCRNNC